MTSLRLQPFGGLSPRTSAQLLPDSGAQEASNVILTSGEIRPMRKPTLVTVPVNPLPKSIFKCVHGVSEKWLDWIKDVDCALVPLSVDVEPRYVWAGDGEPRYSKFSALPAAFYALGVPTPLTAPTVNHSGGTGAAESRFYTYTFTLLNGTVLWEGSNSPLSGFVTGKVDGTWAITGMDALPANSGTGTGVFSSGETAFTNAGNHWLRAGDEVVIGGVTMPVTTITSNSIFKVAGDYHTATAWARKAPWDTAGMTRGIYRTSGATGQFQLVAEGVSATTYNDTLTASQIPGDELISAGWTPPRPGLKGLFALPDGSLAGFVNNILCRSEPYQPHAWPATYERAADYEIIGAQSFGTTIVAATAANPYVAEGVDPESVTLQKIDKVWPCLAKRSVVSLGDGVLYATKDGIAYVGQAGPSVWTAVLYTVEEWFPLNPASMFAAVAQEKVFIAYTLSNGTTQMLMVYPAEQAALTQIALSPTELYADPRDGNIYYVDADGIKQWNSGIGEFLSYTWRSKEFNLAKKVNFGAAKVEFSSAVTTVDSIQAQANYQADLLANQAIITAGIEHDYGDFAFGEVAVADDNLTDPRDGTLDRLEFKLLVDGGEKFSRVVTSTDAFRLPAGFKADTYSIQVSGTVKIQSIKLAETMRGLAEI